MVASCKVWNVNRPHLLGIKKENTEAERGTNQVNPNIAQTLTVSILSFFLSFLSLSFFSTPFFADLFVASLGLSNGMQPTEPVGFGIHFKANRALRRKEKRENQTQSPLLELKSTESHQRLFQIQTPFLPFPKPSSLSHSLCFNTLHVMLIPPTLPHGSGQRYTAASLPLWSLSSSLHFRPP